MSSDWHLAIDFGTSTTTAAHTASLSGKVEPLTLTHHSDLLPPAMFLAPDDTLLTRRSVPTSHAIAAVLFAVVAEARHHHDEFPPTTVTLTHPEAWSGKALSTLTSAAAEIGITRDALRTLSEPRAAARYFAGEGLLVDGNRLTIFDFGDGALDVTVLEAGRGGFRVMATRSDSSLGGRNFDVALHTWVLARLEENDPAAAAYYRTAGPALHAELLHKVRSAKEALSHTETAALLLSVPTGEVEILLTRADFARLIDSDVDCALDLTRATLRDAGVEASMTTIYLVGGTSLIPYVQQRVGDLATIMRVTDPTTVNARGALMETLAQLGSRQYPEVTGAAIDAAADAVPSSLQPAATRAKKKLAAPLIAAAALVAAVVVGGGIWAITSLGGDDSSPAPKPTGAAVVAEEDVPPEVSSASEASPEAGADGFDNLAATGLHPDIYNVSTVEETLPPQLQRRIDHCILTTAERSIPVNGVTVPYDGYKAMNCLMGNADFTMDVITDESAVSALDSAVRISNPDVATELVELSAANGGNVYLLKPSIDVLNVMVAVTYPDDDVALWLRMSGPSENAEALLSQVGLIE